MLKFPGNFVNDERAETLIEKNINDLLLNITSYPMERFADEISGTDTETPFVEHVDRNRELFGMYISSAYELPFKPEESFRIFAGLYCLLNSKNKYIPTLRMEKLMAHLIIAANETNKVVGPDSYELAYESKFEDREQSKVVLALYRDWESYDPKERNNMDVPGIAIRRFERPDDFLELCFWDDDWSYIDAYEEIDLPERWWEEEYRGEAQE